MIIYPLLTDILQTAGQEAARHPIIERIASLGLSWPELYLVMCLISFPIIIFLFFLLARFTNFFERLNAWLDRKAQRKNAKSQKKPEKPAVSENKTDEKKQEKPTEDDDEIARFRLYVGNGYKCRLPENDPGNTKTCDWISENVFVGDFKKGRNSNLFQAERAGTSCLLFDDRTYYEIHVMPNNPKWFADKYFNMIIEQRGIDEFKLDMAEKQRKILLNDFDGGNFSYEGEGPIKRYSFSGNTQKMSVNRILFEICFKDDEYLEFVEDLKERMAPLMKYDGNGRQVEEPEISLWYHETLKKSNGHLLPKVDVVAFIKKLENGNHIFGIGRAWRLYAERVEVQDNRNMIMKSFYSILPKELKYEVDKNDKSFVAVEDDEIEDEGIRQSAEPVPVPVTEEDTAASEIQDNNTENNANETEDEGAQGESDAGYTDGPVGEIEVPEEPGENEEVNGTDDPFGNIEFNYDEINEEI